MKNVVVLFIGGLIISTLFNCTKPLVANAPQNYKPAATESNSKESLLKSTEKVPGTKSGIVYITTAKWYYINSNNIIILTDFLAEQNLNYHL